MAWIKKFRIVTDEHKSFGFVGRFDEGLPPVNDGSLVFLQQIISKMKPAKDDRFLRAVPYQSKEETVMTFDPNNPIVQLCAQGMSLEGEGKRQEAAEIFQQAWNIASDDVEKCVAAHYVARHQNSIADKLQWDELALQLAMNVKDDGSIKGIYPSLYLNIAKGYEDLHDLREAQKHYELALHCNSFLLDDGYGRMIQQGVTAGLERIQKKTMARQNPM